MPDTFSRLALAGLLCLLRLAVFSQNPGFQKTFGGIAEDQGRSIVELSDGYLIAGITQAPDSSLFDALLIRTDLTGAILWQKSYDAFGNEGFQVARPANDGGFIAFGYTTGAGDGPVNAWLVRLDDNGNVLWQKTLGQAGQLSYGVNVLPLSDGYILSGFRITGIASKTRGFVTRIDNNGDVIWSKIPFSDRFNTFTAQFIQDGLLYACGSGYVEPFGEKVEGIWLSMDIATGQVVQSFRYFGQDREDLYSIRPTADGNLIMCGVSHPYSLLISPPSLAWVQKVRPDGSVIWAKTYRILPWLHHLPQLETDSDGGYMMSLWLYFRTTSNSVEYDENALLVKLDADGNFVWDKFYGDDGFNQFSQLRPASDGGWMTIGYTKNTGFSLPDLLVAKTDPEGLVETCCTPHSAPMTVTDFVDTVMTYDLAPVDFAVTHTETGWIVNDNPVVAADVCPSQPTVQDSFRFCPGESLTIGGIPYDQPGTVELTLPAFGNSCDTLATYVLEWLPQPTLHDTLRFCPGQSVSLGGVSYDQPGTVVLYLPVSDNGCDTLATYILEWLPQPVLNDTLRFCAGDNVTLGGTVYDQPGTVSLALPASGGGCDTLATYVLEYLNDHQPNTLSLSCPANISSTAATGASSLVVNYNPPSANSGCPCPGLTTTLVSGGSSGSAFPVGLSTVCYRADDACGYSTTCCFTVNVEGDDPCDVKTIGCVKFELLDIQRDAALNWAYRVRITNHCAAELTYAYIQVPDGLTAFSPANNAVYTAPSGRAYLARNPNYSPMYSVRFKPQDTGISAGQSDVFRYVLPQQADVDYINVGARLSSGAYLESHLNTFNCPVGTENFPKPAEERRETGNSWRVFPNPLSNGSVLNIEGAVLAQGRFVLRDLTGRLVLDSSVSENQVIAAAGQVPAGVYMYRIFENGEMVGSGKLVVLR